MDRVTAIVVKLENGNYRRLNLKKIKAIYTDAAYMCAGTVEQGEDDVAGPETKEPDFSSDDSGAATRSASADGGGDPPLCYWVNGVLYCV